MRQKTMSDLHLQHLSDAELNALIEETTDWASSKDSKFYLYQANPVMPYFHSSLAKTRFLSGGNRAGKSEAVAEEAAIQFTGECPPSLVGMIPAHRLTGKRQMRYNVIDYPNAFEKITWPKLQSRIPSDAIKDVIKEQGRIKSITNYKGGFLEFMTYEQDVKKFQGTDRDAQFYDEEPPQTIRDENLMRLVDRDGEEVFGMTPISEENGSGYQPTIWIYDTLFLKAGRIVEREYTDPLTIHLNPIVDKTNPLGDPEIHTFFASIFDNPNISKIAAERILSKYSKEEREAREKGHFMHLSGLIFGDYSDATHLIPSFNEWYTGQFKNDYTLYVAIDPHPRVPHAVLFVVVHKSGYKKVVDEIFSTFQDMGELAEGIHAKCMGKPVEAMIIDHSAFNPESTGRCLAYDLMDAFSDRGYTFPPFISGSKELSRGIILTKAALTIPVYCSNCNTLMEQHKDTPNPVCYKCGEGLTPQNTYKGIPEYQFTNNCLRTRYEITHYRWQNWSKNHAGSKELKQKPVDKDDHLMEDLRRIVTLDPQYRYPSTMIEVEDIVDTRKGRNAQTGY